ncbi:hypothetical protein M408DRAFT_23875 [Serendipita vermifera MAFF 305830]|uniref:Cytochrome P450 n=1 Tax=Serendipita vermifera MAFF 305830 TaxID=933852 RepID=A0A0C2WPN3_SERVB|nr:hypothetical protein M408DRAFT_23875 [Serendipita vermifera MAFF 305830]
MDSSTIVYSATALAVPVALALWSISTKPSQPYPPGPKGYPIIGNILDFPKDGWQRAFTAWQKDYGDIVYVNLMGTPFIIINSLKIAEDLCNKRAAIYSNRQKSIMMKELMGWGWNVGLMQPGPEHSAIRKIFRQNLGPLNVPVYDPLVMKETERLVKTLHKFEGDPFEAVVHAVGSVVITLGYGESVNKAHGAELTELNHKALDLAIWVMTRLWLVEIFPSMRYIPAWVPGATFKRIGARAEGMSQRIYHWPWEEARLRYEQGSDDPCIALEHMKLGEELGTAKKAVAVMYGAGVDTTTAVTLNFLYAMMLHPQAQKKIQAEIDQFTGGDRLLSGADRSDLPYADAAWKESIRWHAPVPLGTPRCTSQSDVYDGMYIPKDAMLWLNVALMLRDPRTFESPEVFQPERWLESHNPLVSELPDIQNIAFGFGTRICPGRYLAERAGFAFTMSLLAAYDIVPTGGAPVPDWRDAVWVENLDSRPLDFKCAFVPRSHLAAHLLEH